MSQESEIVKILTDDSAVKAVNSDRVYFLQAPQKDMSTYIVFTTVKEPIRTKDGIAGYNTTMITEIFAKKNEKAAQLETAVVNAFESHVGTGADLVRKIELIESFPEKNPETDVFSRIIKASLTVKN